jgi:hypothetical protein
MPSAIIRILFQWREINAIRKNANRLPETEPPDIFVLTFRRGVETGCRTQCRGLQGMPEDLLLRCALAKRPRRERPARRDHKATAPMPTGPPRIDIWHHPQAMVVNQIDPARSCFRSKPAPHPRRHAQATGAETQGKCPQIRRADWHRRPIQGGQANVRSGSDQRLA